MTIIQTDIHIPPNAALERSWPLSTCPCESTGVDGCGGTHRHMHTTGASQFAAKEWKSCFCIGWCWLIASSSQVREALGSFWIVVVIRLCRPGICRFTTLDKSSEKSFYSVNSASMCLYWIQASIIVETCWLFCLFLHLCVADCVARWCLHASGRDTANPGGQVLTFQPAKSQMNLEQISLYRTE